MDKREIDAIQKISESMEVRSNETMKDVLEQYDMNVAINVLVNVATSMLAKALIMTDRERRDNLIGIAFRITELKVDEGHAAVESLMAINKAMFPQGGGYTCAPQKKH